MQIELLKNKKKLLNIKQEKYSLFIFFLIRLMCKNGYLCWEEGGG